MVTSLRMHDSCMAVTIRLARDQDRDAVLEVAARTWAQVFDAVNEVLGPDLALRLHGEDWRVYHAGEVREILASESTTTWVAEDDGRVVGFVAARVVDPDRRIGEVRIVGVDPESQGAGIGAALTRHAEAWLRAEDMAVAVIGTGGDPGHAPARALYESLGYRPFPIVQFYKALGPEE
jgi:GNAT superfamily N-acetyltransferase